MGNALATWGARLGASIAYVAVIEVTTGLTFTDARWWALWLSTWAYWTFMEAL